MAIFGHDQPLTFAISILGICVSLVVYFAPLFTFIQICQNKSVLGFHSLPYVVALFSSMVWMYYALVKGDEILLISINSFGCLVETIYISIYLTYAKREGRKLTAKLLGCLNMALFSSILVVTHFLVKDSHRTLVVGWIAAVISISVFAAPLSVLVQVVRTKSVEFMPIGLSCCLTLGAVVWFTYGLCKHDFFIMLPNIFGFILGTIQMFVYGFYRKGKKQQEEEVVIEEEETAKKQEHVCNIMILEGLERVNQKSDDGNKTAMGGQNGHKMEDAGEANEKI